MAFDAQREDYQRMSLRFAQSLSDTDPAQATQAFATFGHTFAFNRDSLPQTDSDRAFHLVVRATHIIDYSLGFIDPQKGEKLYHEAHQLLDEAIALDPHCYDAIRIKQAALSPTMDRYLDFLNERADEVRAWCLEQREALVPQPSEERERLQAHLAIRPYLRWAAAQANMALVCGRNKECLRHAQAAMELDPNDAVGARLTALYAYAKLEDEKGLMSLSASGKAPSEGDSFNPWEHIAWLSLYYKQANFEAARRELKILLNVCPHAPEVLIEQRELPDGMFSRLPTEPCSVNELIVAVSEGVILFAEGADPEGRGPLGAWIMEETARMHPLAMAAVLKRQQDVPLAGGNE